MTKAETRVQIAKDVIKQINSGTLKPRNGIFFERVKSFKQKSAFGGSFSSYDLYDENKEHPEQLCEIIKDLPCKVCALGGIFASTVRRFNKFESQISVDMDEGYEYLEKYFSKVQLDLIEFTFELGEGRVYEKLKRTFWSEKEKELPIEFVESCMKFGKAHKKGAPRMIAIMKNIVKHNGTFKPEVV